MPRPIRKRFLREPAGGAISFSFMSRPRSIFVMAGHCRPKDGVASLAYVPPIHALLCRQGRHARHKAEHDAANYLLPSTTRTRWRTLLIMPRVIGVSGRSRV